MNEFDNFFTDEDIATEGLFDKFKKKSDDGNSKYANAKLTQEMRDEVSKDATKIDLLRREIEKISNDWFAKANQKAFLTGIVKDYLQFNHTSMKEYARDMKTLDDSGHFPIPIARLDTTKVPEDKLDAAKESFQEWFERYKSIIDTFKKDKSGDFSKLCYEKASMHQDSIHVMAGWKVSTESLEQAKESISLYKEEFTMNDFDDIFADEDIATEGAFGNAMSAMITINAVEKMDEKMFPNGWYVTKEDTKTILAAINAAKNVLELEIPKCIDKYGIDESDVRITCNSASNFTDVKNARAIKIPLFTINAHAKGYLRTVNHLQFAAERAVHGINRAIEIKLDVDDNPNWANIEMIYHPTGDVAKESIDTEFNDFFDADDDIANEAIGDKKTRVFQITAADKKRCITACKAAKTALKRDIPIIADKYGFSPKDVEISKDLNTTSINDISADKLIFNLFSFDTSVKGLTIGHTKIFNNVKKAIKDACPMMEVKPDPRGKSYVVYMEYTPTGKDVTKQYKKDAGMESIDASFDGIFDDFAFESVATNLKRDLQDDPEEAMSLKSMYNVYMNEDALKKYEEKYDQLKHINKNAENLRGHMYFMNGELVAFISVEYKSGKTWIDTLEVVKKFRGNKLSFQLLDVAVRKFHATDLRVNKDNEKAIGIFKTYGFKTYDRKGNWIYMTLRADAKEIENKETEKAQPVTANLKSDTIKEAKQQTANEAAMDVEGFDEFLMMCLESANGVKSVDDLLDEAKVTLNKKLKTVEDCEAYLEVIKNESAKFNEACSCLISAYAKYNHSKKERADTIDLKKTTSAAILLLNQNCRALNVRLGDIAHKDGEEISRNDIKRFGQYVAGIRKITNEIKDARKKGIALEYALPDDEIEDADIALESAAAAEEFFEFMDSEDAEPAQEQYTSDSYDDDEDWGLL